MATEHLELTVREGDLSDISRIMALESAGFPEDEAASEATMRYRLQNAPQYYRTWSDPSGTIIGYVCGTCSRADTLEHESMFNHDSHGHLLCIHSVVVDTTLRRQGIATRMLKEYVQHIASTQKQVTAMALLSKERNAGLYQRCGFVLIGESHVQHGSEKWLELKLDLNDKQYRPT